MILINEEIEFLLLVFALILARRKRGNARKCRTWTNESCNQHVQFLKSKIIVLNLVAYYEYVNIMIMNSDDII